MIQWDLVLTYASVARNLIFSRKGVRCDTEREDEENQGRGKRTTMNTHSWLRRLIG